MIFKRVQSVLAREIHAHVEGKRFALIVALISAFVAGAAFAELDHMQRFGLGRQAEITSAVICLAAVAAVLHALGHVSTSRLAISRAAFQSGVAVLLGAGAATVLNQTMLG